MLSVFSLIWCQAAEVAVGSTTVKSIDVEDLLAARLSIDRTPRQAEDCACEACSGGGFRAKRYCKYVRQFRDLRVERISEVTIQDVDVSKVPSYRKDERLEFENRWADPYQFE
jgi:hypothetical protein